MAEIWPPYSFGNLGVKIILSLWAVKNVKNLTIACGQAKGHRLNQISFIFGA